MNPALLIASPEMRDPLFERSVVLLWHHDEEGAIGVVVNKPLEHKLGEVLVHGENLDLSSYAEDQVCWGGPVETGSGTVVTQGQVADDEGWSIAQHLSVTRSQEALLRLLGERASLILCLGYAGWGPGQLEDELEAGGWLWAEATADVVFSTPIEARYERALATLGLTPATAAIRAIDA
jgi:putative transcriptional regulator